MAKKFIGIAAIVAATLGEAGFLFVGLDEGKKLAADGLVELNDKVPNTPKGQIAARATQAGIDSQKEAGTAAPKTEFVIESDVAIPAIVGRGRVGGSTYPFDKLAVGQSFFVPKSAKALASTVSSANARYAEVVEGETRTNRKGIEVPKTKLTRQFIVRSVEEKGVSGSRIWRKA